MAGDPYGRNFIKPAVERASGLGPVRFSAANVAESMIAFTQGGTLGRIKQSPDDVVGTRKRLTVFTTKYELYFHRVYLGLLFSVSFHLSFLFFLLLCTSFFLSLPVKYIKAFDEHSALCSFLFLSTRRGPLFHFGRKNE